MGLKGDLVAGIESELEKLSKSIKGGHVVFDCENVGTINSLGIRAWKNFLDKVATKATIEFQRCSLDFVDAANLVSDIQTPRPRSAIHPSVSHSGARLSARLDQSAKAGLGAGLQRVAELGGFVPAGDVHRDSGGEARA